MDLHWDTLLTLTMTLGHKYPGLILGSGLIYTSKASVQYHIEYCNVKQLQFRVFRVSLEFFMSFMFKYRAVRETLLRTIKSYVLMLKKGWLK